MVIIGIQENMVKMDINKKIKNGKGITFNYHLLDNGIYVGEIVNGLKNGKGKEYDEERTLLFEGEYLNNLRHGIGKEYYYNGKIHIEGEYLYGRIWNVKEYDMNNNVIYELKNGKGLVKQFNNCTRKKSLILYFITTLNLF